jgi:NAD dependent epimerase/dehydratase family enzyme
MVTIAVAGGTGNIGRTICDALKGSTKHKTIILARKVYILSLFGFQNKKEESAS